MAKRLMAIPFALAVVLASQTASWANTTHDEKNMGGGGGTTTESTTNATTRAEAAIQAPTDVMVADLPGGHWATNATQWAVANNILTLQNGQFMGNEVLTSADLHQAMESLVNIAETIEGKGALPDLRAAIGTIPNTDAEVNRIQIAQTLARFLDVAKSHELLALGAITPSASGFKDLGTQVPAAVKKVVDEYGVMTGYKDYTFKPNDEVTRYQMAAIAKTILDKMRQAPIAQQPAAPIAQEPTPPTVVVVPPSEPEVVAVTPVEDMGRPNFRQNSPLFLSWQALNSNNFSGGTNQFSTIPVQGMLTGYQGPAMLQAVLDFRYDVLQTNLLNTELRLGYSDLKLGMLQFIPYVGANVGVGASNPGSVQYDTFAGASYGGILSIMPMNNLELWGNFGQSYLLAGGRFNQSFQPTANVNALGTVLSNYGVGLDFYVSPNIALSIGANTWQQPADLRTATDLNAGVLNTYGGNIGVGFSF
jgi:hypothetical protein